MTGRRQVSAQRSACSVDNEQARCRAFQRIQAPGDSVKGGLHIASTAKGSAYIASGGSASGGSGGDVQGRGGRTGRAVAVEKASGDSRCRHSGFAFCCGAGFTGKDGSQVKAKLTGDVNGAR
jgi:hypothetical protein